jgi:transposase
MGAAIGLREDYDGPALRRLAKQTRHASQARRLLALAAIYDGGSRGDAAHIGGVGLQTVRDWVLRFNTHGPEGLIDGKAPGNRARLGEAERLALREIVEAGPIPAVHGVVRWRLKDLVQWLFESFRISVSETTVSRELKRLGFAKLSARPRHHAQNAAAMETFKKTSPPSWRRSRRACPPASG